MSGYSERTECPKCGLNTFEESRDYDYCCGYCLRCGYCYQMKKVENRMALEELNEERELLNLKRISKLKGWK